MTRLIKPVAVAVIALAAVGVLVWGPGLLPERQPNREADEESEADRHTPVLVESATLRPQRTQLEAVGTSLARQSVTLHPAAAGEVVAVNIAAGQRVEAGDVLVELDRRAQQVALELARVRLAEARRVIERYRGMGESGAVSAATLDEARTAVELARLEVRQAEVALADRTVRAPFSGYVGITEVHPGDRIGPETAITTLDDRSVLLIDFEVPELFLGRLERGDDIRLAPWQVGAGTVEGTIADIGARVDSQRRTFPVRARVDNAEDRFRPGMSFRVALQLDGQRFPAVPEVSLQWGGEGAYVWALREGRAHRVAANLVQRGEGYVLIDADIAEGTLIVTEGIQAMREGLEVEVIDRAVGRTAGAEA